MTYCFI